MKRKKINDKKFLRNIIIGIISLLVVAFIINIAPGYKRDKYMNIINLIINEENKTEHLVHDIYVNENQTIYISMEDVRNLFDSTIYYDEEYNQIITTSDTKVANIVIDERQMIINNSNVSMLDAVIRINDEIYLPISDMSIVYNIKIDYINETKRVVIDELDTGLIRAIVVENTDIKYKPKGLSKNIGTLRQGETVSCFYTTSKGWRQIRTSDGIIGYIKANKLGDEYIVRQDMQARGEAAKISRDDYNTGTFIALNSKVIMKDIFSNQNELQIPTEGYKVWAPISNNSIINEGNDILEGILRDYKSRTTFIDLIVKKSIENNINGISIDFTGIEDREIIKRFVIECAPKLREIGISTCIVLNENIDGQDYINIVDYIVE